MLQLILTIIKIIGIILAALLGILLTLILVVLFVPIGYDARIDNKNAIVIKANGWWLFHALHISFDMEGIPSEEKGNSPVIKLRILGIPILDTGKKKEEQQEKLVKARKNKKKKSEKVQSVSRKPEAKVKEKTEEALAESQRQESQLSTQEVSSKEANVIEKVSLKKDTASKKAAEQKNEKKKDAVKKEKKAEKTSKTLKKKKTEKKTNEDTPKVSFLDKIRNLIDGIKKKFQNISDTKQKLLSKVNLIKLFLQNEENIAGIKRIFHSVKKILKQLLPRKIKGHVTFGLNDPCATGQALGILAMFYSYYGKSLVIEPDFTEPVFVADVYLKGYIQIITLCMIGVKVVIDANFRKLIKNFKRLREDFRG